MGWKCFNPIGQPGEHLLSSHLMYVYYKKVLGYIHQYDLYILEVVRIMEIPPIHISNLRPKIIASSD